MSNVLIQTLDNQETVVQVDYVAWKKILREAAWQGQLVRSVVLENQGQFRDKDRISFTLE